MKSPNRQLRSKKKFLADPESEETHKQQRHRERQAGRKEIAEAPRPPEGRVKPSMLRAIIRRAAVRARNAEELRDRAQARLDEEITSYNHWLMQCQHVTDTGETAQDENGVCEICGL